jgi:hypothetical protein
VQTHVGPLQRELERLLEAGQQEGWAKPLPIPYVMEILLPATVSSFNTAAVSTELYGLELHTLEALETRADVLVEIFFQGLVQTAY